MLFQKYEKYIQNSSTSDVIPDSPQLIDNYIIVQHYNNG